MITIGEKTFETARPADLDAQLVAASGCNADEVQRQLQGEPFAGHVARALRPFLTGDGAPGVAQLTDLIAQAGVMSVAAQVGTLYAALPASAEAPHDAG